MIELHANGWKALVSPDFGMNTLFLSYQGEEIFRSPPDMDQVSRGTCVYGNPILLPANRTDGGRFQYKGVNYQLPLNEPQHNNHIHGAVYMSAFHVDSHSSEHIAGHYENKGEIYPFAFRIDIYYWIKEGYNQRYIITNTGNKIMPFSFGLHTNFNERKSFSVDIKTRWEKTKRHIPTGVQLDLIEREIQYRTGFVFDGTPVSGFYSAEGHRAEIGDYLYEVSDNFNQWTLWNGNGNQGFISIEPQCGAVNALNSGIGLKLLEPNQSETFFVKVRQNIAK